MPDRVSSLRHNERGRSPWNTKVVRQLEERPCIYVGLISCSVTQHFNNILGYMRSRQQEPSKIAWQAIDVDGAYVKLQSL